MTALTYSIRQAAKLIGVSEWIIRNATTDGALVSYKHGRGKGVIRILHADLEAYQDSCRRGPKSRRQALPRGLSPEAIARLKRFGGI